MIQAGIEGLRDILDLDLETFRSASITAAAELDDGAADDLRIEGWWEQARTLEDE